MTTADVSAAIIERIAAFIATLLAEVGGLLCGLALSIEDRGPRDCPACTGQTFQRGLCSHCAATEGAAAPQEAGP